MSLARDCDGLTEALTGGALDPPRDEAGILLGFVWLRFELKGEPLGTILQIAGEKADAYDAIPSCEEIYCAARELRQLDASADRTPFVDRTRALFAECRDAAMEKWRRLQT